MKKGTIIISMSSTELEELIQRAVSKVIIPKRQPDKDEFLSRNDTAQYLGVCVQTLHDYNKRGILKPYKIGKKVLYKKADILAAVKPAA